MLNWSPLRILQLLQNAFVHIFSIIHLTLSNSTKTTLYLSNLILYSLFNRARSHNQSQIVIHSQRNRLVHNVCQAVYLTVGPNFNEHSSD